MQSELLNNVQASIQINDKKLAKRHFIYYICTIKVPVSAGRDICTIKKMEGVLERELLILCYLGENIYSFGFISD